MQQKQKDETEILFGKNVGIQINDPILADMGYFIVFLYPYSKYTDKQRSPIKPLILTYRENETLMGQLMDEVISKLPTLRNIYFTLSNGFVLRKGRSVAWLKKFLYRDRIDGLVLFVSQKQEKVLQQQLQEDQDQIMFFDQCCYINYLGKQQEDSLKYNMFVHFKMINTNYTFTFGVQNDTTFEQLLRRFYKEIGQAFQVNFQQEKIKRMFVTKKTIKKQQKYIQVIFKGQHNIWKLKRMSEMNLVANNTTFYVQTTQKIELKIQNIDKHKKILIYKENSNIQSQFYFEQIQFMTFKVFYQTALGSDKKEKGVVRSLKVMDTLVKENETLSKLRKLYQIQDNEIIRLVGKVISQKMYFYKHIGQLVIKDPEFSLQKNIFPPNNSQNQADFRLKIRSRIREKATTANDPHFKNEKNVQSLYLYSTERTHCYQEDEKGVKSKKSKPIYQVVNKRIRQTNFLQSDLQAFSENWIFKYTSSLISQLNKIQKTKQPFMLVYRGINFDLHAQKDETIIFKSFTSTSKSVLKTHEFLLKPNQIMNTQKTLLQMKIRSGKSISQYTQYPQQEVLLPPFTQFKVVSKSQKTLRNYEVTKIVLEEVDQSLSSSKYPETKAHFIIWVDDKLFQANQIYYQIKRFEDPTILIKLKSTKELCQWLGEKKNQQILKDPTANCVFITNMTRDGYTFAGVEGIIQMQNYTKERQLPIFVFVGNLKQAQMNIEKYKDKIRNVESIKIGTKYKEIAYFLRTKVKISFVPQAPQANINLQQINQVAAKKSISFVDCIIM